MSRTPSGALAKFNIPLALLWLASAVVTVVGYLILTSSNAAQAQFYAKQSSEYLTYFTAQSGSGLGSTILGSGVLGLLLALAIHAIRRPIAVAATVATPSATDEFDDFDENELDDEVITNEPDKASSEANVDPELESSTAR